eukprot:GHVU01086779.1.p1 GENE.GHVU01086779.1~~GHVU01086779.1.p1  ORF type:complete len:447 (+),score=66.36 GHVU01086779.1:227-1567(+)
MYSAAPMYNQRHNLYADIGLNFEHSQLVDPLVTAAISSADVRALLSPETLGTATVSGSRSSQVAAASSFVAGRGDVRHTNAVPVSASLPVSSRWSVDPTKAAKTPPPTTDDYAKWSADQVKAECTARKFVHAKFNTDERRKALVEHDHVKLNCAEAVAAPGKRTPSCVARLLNCIFFDEILRGKLIRSGDQQTWQQLGGRASEDFWDQVDASYNNTTPDPTKDNVVKSKYDNSAHHSFSCLHPALALRWRAKKLQQIFKDVNSKYASALAAFKRSGIHDPDFSQASSVAVEVIYMYYLLQHFPDALSYFRAGFPEGMGYNSLRPSSTTTNSVVTVSTADGRTAKSLRVAEAERKKKGGEALESLAQAATVLVSSSTSSKEADLQTMLNGVVEKIDQLRQKVDATTSQDTKEELEVTLTFYRKRRTNLQSRLENLERAAGFEQDTGE